jgi:hypothetical protein
MGFELTRLLNQYGVKAPTMGYAGTSAPVNPGTLKEGATADEVKAFNDLAAKYNTDQPKYQADQATYNQYKTDYQNRVQNTPMYAQAQFQTKQPSSIDDMYRYYEGRAPDVAGKAYWQAEFGNTPLTQAQKNTWLKAAEVANAQNPNPNPHSQDLYNRTGSYWGNQLAMPTYGQGSDTTGFTPIATAPVPVVAVAPTNNGTNGLVVSHGGNGNGTTVGGTFNGDPNSYTGGLLNSVIGQDPTGVPVETINPDGTKSFGSEANGEHGYSGWGNGGNYGGSGGGSQSDGGGNSNRGESGASSSRGFEWGGLVRKYADGGEVQDFGGVGEDPSIPMEAAPSPGANVEGNLGLDVSRLTPAQAQFLAQQDPGAMARGAQRFNQHLLQQAPQQETLPQMAAAYASPEMQLYTQEYQAARAQAAADRANFEKLLQASLDRKDEVGPSKAEMYFNLAAAFGAPTKTGSFGESLANASTVMAGHKKGEREAILAARDRADKLNLEVAKYHADGSKEDLRDLRTLSVAEMKARQQLLEPRSEYGKEALDLHLVPGTPGFVAYVNGRAAQDQERKQAGVETAQANSKLSAERLAEQKRLAEMLTPTEATALGKEQTALDAKLSLAKSLEKAFALSSQALSGSGIDKVKGFVGSAVGSSASSLVAKENLDRILNEAALEYAARLKPMSDTDIAFAQKLTGLAGTSKASRAAQIEGLFAQTRDEIEQHKTRIGKIKSRENRTQSLQATNLPAPLDTVPTGE